MPPKVTTVKSDTLWQITLRFLAVPTNCWLWRSDEGLTLIDCGCPQDAKEIIKVIREIGELKRIIITHAHPDHAGAAAGISQELNVPVCAHKSELEFLQGKPMHHANGSIICKCVMWFAENVGMRVPKAKNVIPVEHEQQIGNFRIVHTPGHTPGSISIFEQSTGALFCGDNLETLHKKPLLGQGWCTLDIDKRNTSIENHLKLNATTLLAGHGNPYKSETLSAELRNLLGR